GNLFNLTFEYGTFDLVYAHQVIFRLPLEKVSSELREMERLCKVGGLVTFCDGRSETRKLQC
ncbi:hypothetical protein BJ878DRAFT_430239, partial [Calycina marina]